MRIMHQDSTAEQETPVERIDGIETTCTDIEGLAEFDVYITEDLLPDEIREDIGIRSWVEHAVEQHLKKHLSEDGQTVACEARATEANEGVQALLVDEDSAVTEYSVWVRFT